MPPVDHDRLPRLLPSFTWGKAAAIFATSSKVGTRAPYCGPSRLSRPAISAAGEPPDLPQLMWWARRIDETGQRMPWCAAHREPGGGVGDEGGQLGTPHPTSPVGGQVGAGQGRRRVGGVVGHGVSLFGAYGC